MLNIVLLLHISPKGTGAPFPNPVTGDRRWPNLCRISILGKLDAQNVFFTRKNHKTFEVLKKKNMAMASSRVISAANTNTDLLQGETL